MLLHGCSENYAICKRITLRSHPVVLEGRRVRGSGDACRGALLALFGIPGVGARVLPRDLRGHNPAPGDGKIIQSSETGCLWCCGEIQYRLLAPAEHSVHAKLQLRTPSRVLGWIIFLGLCVFCDCDPRYGILKCVSPSFAVKIRKCLRASPFFSMFYYMSLVLILN